MESEGSMPHSQGLSNNSCPEPNQPNYPQIPISLRSILILPSHLRLGLPKDLFPVGLPTKILKALLPSSILATCPVHLNLLEHNNITHFKISWRIQKAINNIRRQFLTYYLNLNHMKLFGIIFAKTDLSLTYILNMCLYNPGLLIICTCK